ncbi:MAG: lytic murein transglycosylase [Pseudomonadota bacterium]
MSRRPALWLATILALAPALAEANVLRAEPPKPRASVADRAAAAEDFASWRATFRARALAAGVGARTFDAAFTSVRPSRKVVELDGAQPEFVRPLWQYLESAVSRTRITNGQRMAERYPTALSQIEERYGVDRRVVLSIWGMETAYGAVRGSFDTINALATLAYDGRRRDWAERELIAALLILQNGDVSPQRMRGSWAGAMGHTQFMPTSYQAYAQDFRGDGRRDVWSDDDPTDALASTAHYLAEHGWQKGQPWGYEVRLPQGFNHTLADRSFARPASFWTNAGIRLMTGARVPEHGPAKLILPMGATGPAFLTFSNFDVIKRYNNATSYALAVGHLGDRIYGGAPFQTSWPRDILPLTRTERRELQQRLTALGYDTEGTDGIIGPNSERAIRQFQSARGMTPDGFASDRLLRAVRGG